MMRIQKFMAECGVASRRRSEVLISEGRVKLNDKVIYEPGVQIDPEKDRVSVDNRDISYREKVYLLLNKPKGVVSTLEDVHAEKTVRDLVPEGLRLYPVGRLDKETAGLLLMTNDGEMTFRLTHPSHGFTKTYLCKVKGQLSDRDLTRLQKGVEIDLDGIFYTTMPAAVTLIHRRRGSTSFEITISEGKNRQVRKMCLAVGHEVIDLTRTALGSLKDAQLQTGKWRYLTPEETAYLKGI